ncbi:hypothetical protein BH10ACT1_BH10ACT1_05490 [soil metagenome]
MSLLDDPQAPTTQAAPATTVTPRRTPLVEDADDAAPRPAVRPDEVGGAEPLVRAVLAVLVVAVAIVAVWKAFDQVVAPAWNRSRQDYLAKQFSVPRAGLEPGEAVAVLQIPGIAVNLLVIEGNDPNELRSGPGHVIGTPAPGQKGNSVVEGHFARWGAPFADLPKLVERTRIIVLNRSGIPYEYRVTVVRKVSRSGLARYLKPSSDHRITLVTHAGGTFSDDRFVVQAVSGNPSKKPAKGTAPSLDPPHDSLLVPVLALLACVGAAITVFVGLRRHHSRAILALVIVPLVLGATLALLLAADTTLSPLL